MREKIILNNPERFAKPYSISPEKLSKAIERALDKLERDIPRWTDYFAGGSTSVDYKYRQGSNNNWVCGMQTGLYWLAYELSGNKKFRDAVEKHLPTYRERFEKKIGMDDHDVGFVYTPSCVAAYKITGNEQIKKLLLDVVCV